MNNLLSTQNIVESPFIIVEIGGETFGSYNKNKMSNGNLNVTYPNYMQSIKINKVNGDVNTYTISMVYGVTQKDDPNRLDKVFSKIAKSREIYVSYGDWASPSFIYRREKAIVTGVHTNIDVANSRLTYNITCTSAALYLTASKNSFDAITAKPSDVIKRILNNNLTGIKSLFPGMTSDNIGKYNLIYSNDKKVKIEAKKSISTLDYINYLVSCMIPNTNSNKKGDKTVNTSTFLMHIYDDINNDLGGTYFKVVEIKSKLSVDQQSNVFSIDVGYPSDNFVTNFTVNNNDSWAILFDYSTKINQSDNTYTIDKNGNVVAENSLSPLTVSRNLQVSTQSNRNWWSKVTSFPITASVTIKGLLKPSVLMSMVYVNCYFYGHRHISSGLYVITKQEDSIDSNGYRSTLTLLRCGGDTAEYINEVIG